MLELPSVIISDIYNYEILAIICRQLISIVRILFSSCQHTVQYTDRSGRMGCIGLLVQYILIPVFFVIFSASRCIQLSFVCCCCHLRLLPQQDGRVVLIKSSIASFMLIVIAVLLYFQGHYFRFHCIDRHTESFRPIGYAFLLDYQIKLGLQLCSTSNCNVIGT